MFWTILTIWCLLSYVAGLVMFLYELPGVLRDKNSKLLRFMIFCLAAAPLIAWHGVTHYTRMYIRKLRGLNPKFW